MKKYELFLNLTEKLGQLHVSVCCFWVCCFSAAWFSLFSVRFCWVLVIRIDALSCLGLVSGCHSRLYICQITAVDHIRWFCVIFSSCFLLLVSFLSSVVLLVFALSVQRSSTHLFSPARPVVLQFSPKPQESCHCAASPLL